MQPSPRGHGGPPCGPSIRRNYVMTEYPVVSQVPGLRGSRSGRAASRSQLTMRRRSTEDGLLAECREIGFGVDHRARQDVQVVVQLVERRLRDHQLALAELQFRARCRAPSPTAGTAASRTRAAGRDPLLRQRSAAPPASPQFRHDEEAYPRSPSSLRVFDRLAAANRRSGPMIQRDSVTRWRRRLVRCRRRDSGAMSTSA